VSFGQWPGAWFKRPKVKKTLWGLLETPAAAAFRAGATYPEGLYVYSN